MNQHRRLREYLPGLGWREHIPSQRRELSRSVQIRRREGSWVGLEEGMPREEVWGDTCRLEESRGEGWVVTASGGVLLSWARLIFTTGLRGEAELGVISV